MLSGSMRITKGGCYALDDLCDTRGALDVGTGERLHRADSFMLLVIAIVVVLIRIIQGRRPLK